MRLLQEQQKEYERKRTAFKEYPDNSLVDRYKDTARDMLKLSFPMLSMTEIECALDWSISKHLQNSPVVIDNNYKKQKIDSSILDITNYILDRQPITTSYGVMFSRHGTIPNPLFTMIDGFIVERKKLKKEKFKHPKGSENYQKFDLLQLLEKLNANGLYGTFGAYSSLYYNLYIASSTTIQGRSCNSAAALFFESFLNNNVPFGSINEVMEFIHNVINEKPERVYNDEIIITNNATVAETFYHVMSTCGFGWVPSEQEMEIIWEMISQLDQENLNRVFYKNNLFHFVDNPYVTNALMKVLQKLDTPYMDPNDVPENIKEELDHFEDLLYEYVYYHHQIIDRIEKMDALIRSVSIIQDTDSAIISLDGWYRYSLEKCVGVPMAIKNKVTDIESYLENEPCTSESFDKVEEYDFLSDEIIARERLINPLVVIPQDGLRYSLINIIAHITSNFANDYMRRYCDNANSNVEGRDCFINLKNEFTFRRVLLTDGKKHYASKVELQEGTIIPDNEEKSLDVKGMEVFVKSTVNANTRKRLRSILYNDILACDNIDQLRLLRNIAATEKEIYDSIHAGKKEYFKPVKIKSVSAYEDPMRIQGIKAAYAYNNLHEPGTEAIDTTARNSVDIIKVEITKRNIDRIQESHPYVYSAAIQLFEIKEFKDGIDAIALPLNEPVPSWVIPFVRYGEIINDNVNGFPLEFVGLYRGTQANNSTNLIHF